MSTTAEQEPPPEAAGVLPAEASRSLGAAPGVADCSDDSTRASDRSTLEAKGKARESTLEDKLARLTERVTHSNHHIVHVVDLHVRQQNTIIQELIALAREGAVGCEGQLALPALPEEAALDSSKDVGRQLSGDSGSPKSGHVAKFEGVEVGQLVRKASSTFGSAVHTKFSSSSHPSGEDEGAWMTGHGSIRSICGKILFHPLFETLCAVVITVNTFWMAYQADDGINRMIEGQAVGIPQVDVPRFAKIIESSFTVFYSFEVLIRLIVLRLDFLIGSDCSWNNFDALLVLTAWYDMIMFLMGTPSQGNLSWLRVMRLMKMCKLLRMVRLMRAFKELRLILNSIMSSMKSMVWAVLLILTVAFMFGLCFVQSVTSFLIESPNEVTPSEKEYLLYRWGSVGSSIYSLYIASMGGCDWEDMALSLSPVGSLFLCLYLLYIGFFFCVVTNTLTSLFVESAISNADKDQQAVIQLEMERKEEYVSMLSVWYMALDEDDSGDITVDEFLKHADEPDMVAFALAMDIDIQDVKQFFMVLSDQGQRPVDLETFIVGCIKLKGMAKSMDLMDLIYTHKQQGREFLSFAARVTEDLSFLRLEIAELAEVGRGAASLEGAAKRESPQSMMPL